MQYRTSLAAVALAAMLVACGGRPYTSAVRAAGDSLDGTLGVPCPRHVTSDPDAACTSHGVMRANVPEQTWAGDLSRFSMRQQLKDLATASQAETLLLVDGGSNDVADLLRCFLMFSLELQQPLAPADTRFYQLLAERSIVPEAPDEPHLAAAGGRYMQALADQLLDELASFAGDSGGRRVVVLNIPQVANISHLNAVSAQLAQINGADEAGRIMSMVDEWIRIFNLRLQVRFASESRVAVVDPTRSGLWSRPAQFGFDATRTCPPAAGPFDSPGLPVPLLAHCQPARSTSQPGDPDGSTGFPDDLHGSPMTRLMADLVLHKLRERGWL